MTNSDADFSSDSSDSSDSSAGSSDESESEKEAVEQKKGGASASTTKTAQVPAAATAGDILGGAEVPMELDIVDAVAPSRLWASHQFDGAEDADDDTEGKHPKTLLGDENAEDALDPGVRGNREAFTEHYLGLVTGRGSFGDDLDQLRASNDFGGAASMPLLIAALKEGVNMFDAEQRNLILSAKK